MKEYLAKFRQGSGPLAMNAIDFYREDGVIIEHSWAMGGETKIITTSVPDIIEGFERVGIEV
jgi:hypothetical protein